MQLGEIIANIFAALLVACILAFVFLLAGKPLWPQHEAKMVILLPPDVMTTSSVKPTRSHTDLPESFDIKLVQPRPGGAGK